MDVSLLQLTEFGLILALGIVFSFPVLLFNVRIAPRLGLIDWPKARGYAEDQIPIIGHAIVFLSLGYFGVLKFVAGRFPEIFSGSYIPSESFLTTAAIIAIVGHLDDRRPVSAINKMFFQLVCASFVVFTDPLLHKSLTLQYGAYGSFWGVFFLVALMNAVNFVDGIDGLAGLILFHGALGFVAFSFQKAYALPYTFFCVFFMGILVSFLYLNVLKRKGFLGNIGSYFCSYVLGVIHLSLPIEAYGPISRLSLTGLCFVIPIADSIMVVISRLLTRRSPFSPDKGHLHHRLVQTSLPLRFTLLNFGIISLCGTAIAFAIAHTEGAMGFVLAPATLLGLVSIVAMLIVLVERTSKRRVQAYFKLLDEGETVYFLKYRITNPDGSPIKPYMLAKLEARMNAEIRVTDLCYAEAPDVLFVTLKTMAEPLKGISSRLDMVFHNEGLKFQVLVEQGEFVKVAHHRTAHQKAS